jgi:hypothetical protein
VKVGKIPAPQTVRVGARNIHVWTDDDIEHVRKLLPKIANGRKTRYQKKQSALSSPQSATPKKKRTKKKK